MIKKAPTPLMCAIVVPMGWEWLFVVCVVVDFEVVDGCANMSFDLACDATTDVA